MLIQYRALQVEFGNHKLLSSFAGFLQGLLGPRHLYMFPRGLQEKKKEWGNVQECKLTGRSGCQGEQADGCVRLAEDGRWLAARGRLWHAGEHLAPAAGRTCIPTTPVPPSSPTTTSHPPPLYWVYLTTQHPGRQ